MKFNFLSLSDQCFQTIFQVNQHQLLINDYFGKEVNNNHSLSRLLFESHSVDKNDKGHNLIKQFIKLNHIIDDLCRDLTYCETFEENVLKISCNEKLTKEEKELYIDYRSTLIIKIKNTYDEIINKRRSLVSEMIHSINFEIYFPKNWQQSASNAKILELTTDSFEKKSKWFDFYSEFKGYLDRNHSYWNVFLNDLVYYGTFTLFDRTIHFDEAREHSLQSALNTTKYSFIGDKNTNLNIRKMLMLCLAVLSLADPTFKDNPKKQQKIHKFLQATAPHSDLARVLMDYIPIYLTNDKAKINIEDLQTLKSIIIDQIEKEDLTAFISKKDIDIIFGVHRTKEHIINVLKKIPLILALPIAWTAFLITTLLHFIAGLLFII